MKMLPGKNIDEYIRIKFIVLVNVRRVESSKRKDRRLSLHVELGNNIFNILSEDHL